MWAKATILAAVGSAVLAGCSASELPAHTEGRDDARQPAPATATQAGESEALRLAFEQAMGLIEELRFAEALTRLAALEPLVAGAGHLELPAACMFWKGFCQEKLARPHQAALCYRRVLDMYARTQVAEPARRRLAALDLISP